MEVIPCRIFFFIGTNILLKENKNVYAEVESSSPINQSFRISIDRIRDLFFQIAADDNFKLQKSFI